MSCLPTYKGVRYKSTNDLFKSIKLSELSDEHKNLLGINKYDWDEMKKKTEVNLPVNQIQVISEDYGVVQVNTNPSEEKTKEFIELIKPQIENQLYKENKGKNANEMFHYGLMWARTNKLANPVKIKAFDKGVYYSYHSLDQNGNLLPSLTVLQPIIDEIEKSLRIDMKDYDSVIGNLYLDDQYVYPHKDTTESETARNYPVIVYTIGNNAGLGIVDNNEGKMTFANQYDKQWLQSNEKLKGYTNELKTTNGSIYTFGLDGKGRFELTHSTPMNNKKMKDFPPITLPNGKQITKYTITLTFRRAKDVDGLNVPISPARLNQTTTQQNESSVSNSLGFKGYSGGYEAKGKGTPEGDGKDKAMRKIADGFIGEIINQNSSSYISATTIYNKLPSKIDRTIGEIGKTTNKAISKTVPYTVYSLQVLNARTEDSPIGGKSMSKVIMLARNSEFKGENLNEKTKKEILENKNNGAEFIVGDMPNVDSQFIEYLQEIGAKFTIYHTGNKSRIEVRQELKPKDTQITKEDTDKLPPCIGE